jgi:hypothetical protein
MKETAQPPEPQLGGKGKSEGLVVSGVGAYAAQMIGSASTPQEKTVEELRLARMEKRAREKQFDQRWARLDKWLNDNNIVTPKKQPIWDTVA